MVFLLPRLFLCLRSHVLYNDRYFFLERKWYTALSRCTLISLRREYDASSNNGSRVYSLSWYKLRESQTQWMRLNASSSKPVLLSTLKCEILCCNPFWRRKRRREENSCLCMPAIWSTCLSVGLCHAWFSGRDSGGLPLNYFSFITVSFVL